MDESTINIYNYIKLHISHKFPWKRDWLSFFNEGVFHNNSIEHMTKPFDKTINIYITYSRRINKGNTYRIRPFIYANDNVFIDARYGLRFENSNKYEYTIILSKPCIQWIFWIIQLALLDNRASLVHSSGLMYDNNAILFPAWSGMGKTTLSAILVDKYNMKYLGDDYLIINDTGKSYSFPIPIVLHGYNLKTFSENYNVGEKPLIYMSSNKYFESLIGYMKKILKNQQIITQIIRRLNLYSIRINPSKLFGKENLGIIGDIRKVIWLYRSTSGNLKIEKDNIPRINQIFGCTISDWDSWCTHVILAAVGAGIIDLEKVFLKWVNVLAKAFNSAEHYSVYLNEISKDHLETLLKMLFEQNVL